MSELIFIVKTIHKMSLHVNFIHISTPILTLDMFSIKAQGKRWIIPLAKELAMPKSRYTQALLEATSYYHFVSCCVRRAFLCGEEAAQFDTPYPTGFEECQR